jgi:hypothetical protein
MGLCRVARLESRRRARSGRTRRRAAAQLHRQLSRADASYLLHVDVGMRRDAIANIERATWGVAYERAPDARLGGFVEAFGVQGEAPTLQAGLRYDLVPQRLSTNFTVGAQCRAGLRDPFITLGFNL